MTMENIITKTVIIIGSIVAFLILLAAVLMTGFFLLPFIPFFLIGCCAKTMPSLSDQSVSSQPSLN